ncbi:MAG: tyrosine-type recombinase/integrase [Acidimicrobiales bacterium]
MFEQIIRKRRHIEYHRSGPHAEERVSYLLHIQEEGRTLRELRRVAGLLLCIARRVDISQGNITAAQLDAAAESWLDCRHPRYRTRTSGKRCFLREANRWLRFLGRLQEPVKAEAFGPQVAAYVAYSTQERGLAPATIESKLKFLQPFLLWLPVHDLRDATPEHFSDYLRVEVAGRWSRVTIADWASVVRCFFRFAESQHWCAPGLAATIDSPRLYKHERLPRGPKWSEVQQLVASASGDTPMDIRDRAMLLLLTVHGLRSGEVRHLRLDDIDWEQETIRIFRSKQRRTQYYPLIPAVGDAILRYIREVRPSTRYREIFFCSNHPHKPLTRGGLHAMVRDRFHKIGLMLPRCGPHALRHSCATYLLAEGFLLKEIGDHLGHTSALSTEVYAKVDLHALREVSQRDDMRELASYMEASARKETPVYRKGDFRALQLVADFSLGGLL